MSLQDLSQDPFRLLLTIEGMARDAVARRSGGDRDVAEWIGVSFRLATEQFVTARASVREVLPLPEQVARIPGAKTWLRGIANVRGQLLTIVDLKAFLGGGTTHADRKARMLVIARREVPCAIIVDEVMGFRRFADSEFDEQAPATNIRCDHYLTGEYRREGERYPLFDLTRLLEDPSFLNAGQLKAG